MTSTAQDIGGDADPYFAGDSLEITIDVDEPDGSVKDLTGASVAWGVARDPGDGTVLTGATTGVSVSITDAANGEVTVTVDAGVTDDLAGAYVHELEVTDVASDQDTVMRGAFKVDRDIVD